MRLVFLAIITFMSSSCFACVDGLVLKKVHYRGGFFKMIGEGDTIMGYHGWPEAYLVVIVDEKDTLQAIKVTKEVYKRTSVDKWVSFCNLTGADMYGHMPRFALQRCARPK
jgi:hypothetical protein